MLGPPVVSRGFGAVSPEVRTAVAGAVPGRWVPIASVETGFDAVAHAANRDVASLHNELARLSVERALKSFWRVLLRLTTDSALTARTPVLFGKSYNRGRLTAEIPRSGFGEVRILDWPNAPEWPVRGTRIGIETVLRVAGREDVRVEGRRTATGAHYQARWK